MNKDPKKVYILEDGNYTEITYEQFCQIRSSDEEYKKKHRFIRLHGVLMEVTEKDYKTFYKTRRRQRYLKERAEEKKDVSIDTLTKEKYGGEIMIPDTTENVEMQVERKLMLENLKTCILLLPYESQKIIYLRFYENMTEEQIGGKQADRQDNRKNKKTFKKLKIYGCETLTFSAYIVRASFLTLVAL
jgi:DNA-directed RNA polymerase specialized sigma subunit